MPRPRSAPPADRPAPARRRPLAAARTAVALVAAVVVLGAAACGSDGTTATDTTPTSDTAPPTTAPPITTPDTVAAAGPLDTAPTDVGTVGIAESTVGPVLVDSRGKALYVFLEDTPGGAPTCTDAACAEKWPAALADEVVVAAGVDAAALGTVERADGTRQLTAGGMPLYTMAADLTDGEPSCQGGEDVWWAVAPDGTPNRTEP